LLKKIKIRTTDLEIGKLVDEKAL